MGEEDEIKLVEFVKWIEDNKKQVEEAKEKTSRDIAKGKYNAETKEKDKLMTIICKYVKERRTLDIVLGKVEEYKNNGGSHK